MYRCGSCTLVHAAYLIEMANLCFAFLITVSLIGNIVCPPVDPKKSDPNDVKSTMQDAENDVTCFFPLFCLFCR